MVADKETRMLAEGILDYLQWIKSIEEHNGSRSSIPYSKILIDFLMFIISKDIACEEMFTLDTLKAFRKYSGFKNASRTLIALSDYLFSQGRIDKPLEIPKPHSPLPEIYEQYLLYQKQSQQVSYTHANNVRRVLFSLHGYLEKHSIKLSSVKIEHLDAFMATFKVSHNTRRIYRYHLRGFLKYLYRDRKIINKDLAPLLVGPPMFAQAKLPKFLRPQQVKQLFASLKLSTPTDIRTYAMVHLAYSLGLRPVEISRITLNDISFSNGEITLADRKFDNPITLPVPEKTIKLIALYLTKARPKSLSRHLFLTHHFPYNPISSNTVVQYISKAMKEAGLPSSSYWLRHTYAQNLLQTRATIYEIKEMLGHQNIQSSQRYINIDVQLMRKVLFHEKLS